MDNNKVLNSSTIVELAESKDGLYLDLTGQLCYMDDYNSNGIRLLKGENFEENLQSLVDTPIVAKYTWDEDNGSDFRGHEAYQDWMTGNILFDTEAIGVHQKVWVENKMVTPVFSEEEVMLPVIMYKARIWADRFPKMASVIKKLYNKNNLGTSWELIPNVIKKETTEIKAIPNPRSSDSWNFIGNAILGFDVLGAYEGTSKVTNVATADNIQFQLAEALKEDMKTISDNKSKDKISNERSTNMEEELKKLQEQLDIANAKIAEYAEAGKDAKILELDAEVKALEVLKSEAEENLVKASNAVESLTAEVAELTPYKEKIEKIEAEKEVAEKAEKIEELKSMVTEGGFVTEAELETSEEIKTMIDNCEEGKLKILRAERIIAKLDVDAKDKATEDKTETAETRTFSEETKQTDAIKTGFWA